MNGLPKLNWRWLASFSFAIIAMVLAVHVKAQDSTIDPIATPASRTARNFSITRSTDRVLNFGWAIR